MCNTTCGHDMKPNKNVMKINNRLRCIKEKLKLVNAFVYSFVVGLCMRK